MGKRHLRSERDLTSQALVVYLSSWLRRDTGLSVEGAQRNTKVSSPFGDLVQFESAAEKKFQVDETFSDFLRLNHTRTVS